jgi:hypothetical protein
MFRKKQEATKAPVTQDQIDQCVARAVAEGDMVNLRFIFSANSPLRDYSSEDITTDKYAYLRPEDPSDPRYQEGLKLASTPEIQQHNKAQLEYKGPPQLHAELVLRTGDNALRLEKYTVAAQAYELLRIREKMRESFLDKADQALDQGDVAAAVRGYVIGTGLRYDYAAFPEPLPGTPSYQSRALMLHAVYPQRPEDAVCLLPPKIHTQAALEYLLLDAQAAARLMDRPEDQLLDFLDELVRQRDAEWPAFVARYKEACDLLKEYGEAMKKAQEAGDPDGVSLAEEIRAQQDQRDPAKIPAKLLGREIPDGEWWQYLKELAYEHPAAALFVTRQYVTRDTEIIMPRYVKDSPVVTRLGLA